MTDPHWTSYVGMATGIVGSLTGIAGATMGCVSYRKSKNIKKLDLRIELKRALSDIIFEYKELLRKMEEGNKSRKAVAAVIGHSRSRFLDNWDKAFEQDQKTMNDIANELPDEDHNYDDLDDKDLEDKLIEIHKISKKIQKILNKYIEAMAWDDERRREIHAAKFSNVNR